MYHNFNTIYQKIKSALVMALKDNGFNDWQVVQSNQPTIQAVQNKTVYFDVISKRRLGIQGNTVVKDDSGNWQTESSWDVEFLIQVSAFMQRTPEDTVNTITSSDVISVLQACFNSNELSPAYIVGDEVIPESEVSQIINPQRGWFPDWLELVSSTDIRELDFETDSGLKEKFPQFDFTLIARESILKTSPDFDNIELATTGV